MADDRHETWAQLFADFTDWRYLGKTPFEFERLIGQLPDPVDTPEVTPPGIFSVARRLGAEGVARLIAAYEAGTPTTQLTRDFGIAKGSVLRLLEQNGVAMRQQPIPVELIPKAAELYNEGLSLTAVSDRLGVNRSTLFHAQESRCGPQPEVGLAPRRRVRDDPSRAAWAFHRLVPKRDAKPAPLLGVVMVEAKAKCPLLKMERQAFYHIIGPRVIRVDIHGNLA